MRELLNCLYVQTEGTVLHLDHDAVLARCDEEPLRRVPLRRLEGITAIGRVSLTPALIHRCGRDGITITWLTDRGRYTGALRGRTNGNVLLRLAQYRAYEDISHRLDLARTIVAGKLVNSARFARHAARLAPSSSGSADLRSIASDLDSARPALPESVSLDQVRGIEGAASKLHFSAVRLALRHDLGFEVRSRRPPRSPFNALISFVYGLARGRIEHGCESVGLDPQVGFLHSVRPGRPSLALDLLEEHRSGLDHLCVTLVNRRQVGTADFEIEAGGAVNLTDSGRKNLLTMWSEHLDRLVRHQVLREEIPYGLIFSVQATLMARHLRGDLAHYLPFIMAPD
jgi:CRISPR-associated protein Cas1